MRARGHITIGCEIIAALIKADRTVNGAADMAGCSSSCAYRWMTELRSSGLVYRRGYADEGKRGAQAVVYAWQSSPFAQADLV